MWFKKLFMSDNKDIWSENIRQNLNIPIDLVSLGSTNIKKSQCQFVNQLVQIWHEVLKLNPPKTPEQIINEPLWCNYFITQNEKTLFFKNWYSAGYKVVGDVWNFETNSIKSKESLTDIYLLTDRQYDSIFNVIDVFKNVLVTTKPTMIERHPKLRTNKKYFLIEKTTSRLIYQIMITNDKKPSHEITLQRMFNEELDWKEIYLAAPKITNIAYLLQTHNIN